MSKIISSAVLRRQDKVETEQIEGEWILLDLSTHSVTKLNELGGMIWSLIPECQTIEEIVNRIQSEYQIEHHIVDQDVRLFIGDLMSAGLVSYA
ncbi:PqqD family protein [Paenibacillus pini]|uniref:Coenzyme PQQ synthesis protein D n=1 Tax=Paenibacillus pini JCM 16418 TaxID=1236976 RepID=W7YU28_9BACL|nr:PqqD family protein [Paenibacillus pini]GAF08066.1 hypothetical protein JCM16418_2104 [Paenibacillus pini JCM 16418]